MNPLSQLSIGKRVLGALPETVRKLIASGDLKAYRLGGDRGPWRIRPEALRAYRGAAGPTSRRPEGTHTAHARANMVVDHTTGYT